MILSATVSGTLCYLLANRPVGVVKVGVSRLSERHDSLTKIEECRILGASLRLKLDYSCPYTSASQAKSFFAAVRDPLQRPILCPLWPAAIQWGTAARFSSGLTITWEDDWSKWEVHSSPSPSGFTPSSSAWTAPLLWGYFGKSPDPGLDTPEIFDAAIAFVENGPVAYAVTPLVAPSYGPLIQGQARPLLDFYLEDYGAVNACGVDLTITRTALGFGRAPVETFYPQTPRRTLKAMFTGRDADSFARFVATFHVCAGAVRPLWFPSIVAPTRLTASPTAASSVISVLDAAALNGHPYVALSHFSGITVARSITAINGNNLTLNSPPGDMRMEDISLQWLLLGRFLGDDITVNWSSSAYWTCQTSLIELPPSYSAPAGEVYGTTYGDVGSPVQLFEVTDQVGGVWNWTNYEADVLVNGTTYTAVKIDWDEISTGINLDDGTCRLSCDSWEGNPFMRLLIPRRGQQLTVVLKEWDVEDGTVDYLWKGYARSAKSVGRILDVPLKGEGKAFDLNVPRRLDSPTCSWVVYGPGCPVNPATKAKVGTLVSIVSGTTVRVQLATSALVHAFANGWMSRATPGAGSPTYSIADSTASSSNMVDVTLDMALFPGLTVGEQVTLYPSCSNSWESCIAPVPADVFGGAPRKPATNPSFVAIKQGATGGGKK
jgi:hypothetical protein